MTFEQNAKEILKSAHVVVSFLLLCYNTMRESSLEEEGFICLAIPGCSPMEQRSQNDTGMHHLIVKNREINACITVTCLYSAWFLYFCIVQERLAKGAVLPKVGYVFSHQLAKTVFWRHSHRPTQCKQAHIETLSSGGSRLCQVDDANTWCSSIWITKDPK